MVRETFFSYFSIVIVVVYLKKILLYDSKFTSQLDTMTIIC